MRAAAYAISKQANHLRVQAAAVTWGDRGARINCISPGIILIPLARDEMSGPGAEGYQKMIETSAAGRVGTTDEVGTVAAFLLGSDAGFITGTDLLIDGGVIAPCAPAGGSCSSADLRLDVNHKPALPAHEGSSMQTVTLNNGVEMPILGFGVYQIPAE